MSSWSVSGAGRSADEVLADVSARLELHLAGDDMLRARAAVAALGALCPPPPGFWVFVLAEGRADPLSGEASCRVEVRTLPPRQLSG